jgi:hypothetical protein
MTETTRGKGPRAEAGRDIMSLAKGLLFRPKESQAAAVAPEQPKSTDAPATDGELAQLAKARRLAGDFAGAAELIADGKARFGETHHLLREAAELASAEARWADAAALWSQVVERAKGKTPAHSYVRWAGALIKLGAAAEAREVVARGLERHPDDLKLNNEAVDLAWDDRAERARDRVRAPAENISVERICALFWELEDRLSLLAWRAGGVAPWPLLRMPLYYSITQKLGLYDPPHPELKSRMDAARGLAPELEADWARREEAFKANGSQRDAKGARAAVLMATRKVGGEETYTAAVRAELGDRALLLDVAPDAAPGVLPYHAYKDMFRARYRRRELYRLPDESNALCEAIWSAMLDGLGVDIGNLARVCRNRVAEFDAASTGFELLFRMEGIDTLYLTNAYGTPNRAVVHAAGNAGARVIELQHGFISRYHLGYSWPGRPDVPYSPDELWCFGSYWPETTPLPKSMGWRVIGAPYVRALAEAEGSARDDNLVVFTSQGVIGRRLFPIALETARRRPDKTIVFRLHPNEARESYEALLADAGGAPENFAISHQTPNIFALLASASIQVGVFSTTLFEGMTLGTRTVIVDMPGVEYMRPAVERGDVLFVGDVDELAARLDQAPLCADPKCYYATPVSPLL